MKRSLGCAGSERETQYVEADLSGDSGSGLPLKSLWIKAIGVIAR
jgi:hypothetical protein